MESWSLLFHMVLIYCYLTCNAVFRTFSFMRILRNRSFEGRWRAISEDGELHGGEDLDGACFVGGMMCLLLLN